MSEGLLVLRKLPRREEPCKCAFLTVRSRSSHPGAARPKKWAGLSDGEPEALSGGRWHQGRCCAAHFSRRARYAARGSGWVGDKCGPGSRQWQARSAQWRLGRSRTPAAPPGLQGLPSTTPTGAAAPVAARPFRGVAGKLPNCLCENGPDPGSHSDHPERWKHTPGRPAAVEENWASLTSAGTAQMTAVSALTASDLPPTAAHSAYRESRAVCAAGKVGAKGRGIPTDGPLPANEGRGPRPSMARAMLAQWRALKAKLGGQ